MIDFQLQRQAGLQRALLDRAEMDVEIARFLLRIGNAHARTVTGQHAGVTDLTAGFGVERRLVHHNGDAVASLGAVGFLAVLYQRGDDAFGDFGVVSKKFCRTELLAQWKPDVLGGGVPRSGPGRARLGTLLVHRVGERGDVNADAAVAQRILCQIEREAIGVIQRERGLAVEHVALLQRRALLVENRKATIQCLAKAGLFQLQRFLDQILRTHQFRIGLAHLPHQRPDKAIHQRFFCAEQLAVAHGAAHDPAQHIAAAFVRRQHTVRDQERRGTQVIGDHPQRCLLFALRISTGQIGNRADQRDEQIDVVIVVLALKDGGDALEAHAGVDGRFRQRHTIAGGNLVELHEHEIPDFDETVAVFFRRARRAAPDLISVIEEDFRARAARAGVAHLPEVVRGRDLDDLRFGQARDLLPETEGFFVLGIDRDKELVLRKPVFPGD